MRKAHPSAAQRRRVRTAPRVIWRRRHRQIDRRRCSSFSGSNPLRWASIRFPRAEPGCCFFGADGPNREPDPATAVRRARRDGYHPPAYRAAFRTSWRLSADPGSAVGRDHPIPPDRIFDAVYGFVGSLRQTREPVRFRRWQSSDKSFPDRRGGYHPPAAEPPTRIRFDQRMGAVTERTVPCVILMRSILYSCQRLRSPRPRPCRGHRRRSSDPVC